MKQKPAWAARRVIGLAIGALGLGTFARSVNFKVGGVMAARWLAVLSFSAAVAYSHPRLRPEEVYNSSVITEDEIVDSPVSNVQVVIHKLRANFRPIAV
jgi:hypothetical protein